MKRSLAAILLISWQSLTLAGAQEAEWCISKHGESGAAPCFNLPDWVLRVAQSAKFPAEYDLSHHLNPYFQSGDFDADGKLDVAVLVRQKSTGRSGIAIFLYGKTKPVVLGAGRSFGNGGTDFSWMDNWSVYSKAEFARAHGKTNHLRPKETPFGLLNPNRPVLSFSGMAGSMSGINKVISRRRAVQPAARSLALG